MEHFNKRSNKKYLSIHSGRNALHVLNAPSPAATAALAIGEEIVKRLEM